MNDLKQKLIKSEKFGSGKSKFTFVVGLHGDEAAPVIAASELKKIIGKSDLRGSFQIVYANTQAIKEKKRFIEFDLNRCFPGRENGKFLEEKIAFQLVRDLKSSQFTFDFHATDFSVTPYALISVFNKQIEKILEQIGIRNALFSSEESLIKYVANGVAIEVGQKDSIEAVEACLKIMLQVVNLFGICDKPLLLQEKKVRTFLIYRFLSKKGLVLDAAISDFKYVKKGQRIGWISGDTVVATEGFYPVWVNFQERLLFSKRIKIYDED